MRAVALVGLVLMASAPARAEEPRPVAPLSKPPVGAVILDLMSQPVESQESAFRESLKRDAPARPSSSDLPPGVSIVVRNPCPSGDPYHDPMPRPLPGRTRR
jgi:hypothetical protein